MRALRTCVHAIPGSAPRGRERRGQGTHISVRKTSIRFADGVRVAPTGRGAILATPVGCRELKLSSSTSVSQLVPLILQADRADWPEWVSQLCADLERLEVLESCEIPKAPTDGEGRPLVGIPRETRLTSLASEALCNLGVPSTSNFLDASFVLMDLSGLSTEHAFGLAKEVHRTGTSSVAVWTVGSTAIFGPLSRPGRTACWNCARIRFSDSPLSQDSSASIQSEQSAQVAAELVFLAVSYGQLTPYGSVLVEDGENWSIDNVVPVPQCTLCGGVRPEDYATTAIVHSLLIPERLRVLAGNRGGIIKKLLLFDGGDELPPVPSCAVAQIAGFNGSNVAFPALTGEGKGATQEDAVWSAIGEGIERYSASMWDPDQLLYAPMDDISSWAFDPRCLVLYDDEQYDDSTFPFARYDPSQPIHWSIGRWLDDQTRTAVPALATFLGFPAPRSERFAQTTSNGLAAGSSLETATLSAIYELIERDAFMLFWLTGLPGTRVADEGLSPATRDALGGVERLGATTELYLIDAGLGHPTMVCIGFGDGQTWPGVTIGLGTDADAARALEKAAFEHAHFGVYLRRLMLEDKYTRSMDATDVKSALDHALYYVNPEKAIALHSFRASADDPVTLAELRARYRLPSDLHSSVRRLRASGIRLACVDVTSPDVALGPLRVVRVVGTHMQPIHFGVGNRRLRNPRLHSTLVGAAPEVLPHPIA
jgi:ribosomal protein S12 methylthiotransferase accessory factor